MKNVRILGAYTLVLSLTACGGGGTESLSTKSTGNEQLLTLSGASAVHSTDSASINHGVRQAAASQATVATSYWVSSSNELSEPLRQALSNRKVNFVHQNEDRFSALFFNSQSMPNNWLDMAKSSLAQGKVLMMESPEDAEADQKMAQAIQAIAGIGAQARYVVVLPCQCKEGVHTIVQFQDDQLDEALNLVGSATL